MNMPLSRRSLLRRAASAFALSWASPAWLTRQAAAASGRSLATLDATAQAALVEKGEVTPIELTWAAIQRIKALNPAINAVVTELFERALNEAAGELPHGPFRGVPYLIKDLDDYAGARRTSGSRLFADHVAEQSSPHVRRSLEAGLVVLGKSNTPAFGLLATTESLLLGACHNPWDLERSPGGSSGGAAAATAAGMVPFAHATDGGGSIRIPASCCGLFGLKPSRGRIEYQGDPNLDISVQHCVSRSVRDSARLFVANQARESASLEPLPLVEGPSKRRLKIALDTTSALGEAPHPDVAEAVRNVASLCETLGHRVDEASPTIDGAQFTERFMALWAHGPFELRKLARDRGLDPERVLEPWTLGLAEHYATLPEDALERTSAFFADVTRRMDAFFSEWDVLLTPVLSKPPIALGVQAPTVAYATLYERVTHYAGYTPLHNAAGTPAMSVPLSFSSAGLPIGSQFATRLGGERTLFALAYELERARPWADHWATHAAPRA